MSTDDAVILDVLGAARLAIEFTEGMERSDFLADRKTQSAVLHQLLVLGEGVKRLSPEFCEAHPELPWRLMAGMRDKLIHHYDAVDLDQVWTTVRRDLPQVVAVLEPLAPPA